PVIDSKSAISFRDNPLLLADATIPVAIGCSECCSKLAAQINTSSSSYPSFGTISVTPNSPSVSVPVLSNTTASKSFAPSKFVRLRINKPCFADNDVETATTNGAANPSACGQVITITVTMRSNATSKEHPKSSQIASLMNPEASAT